jgi:isoleucyl-tRNA synthetase
LSELNTLVKHCRENYADYEPTKAGREIQDFVDSYLSNWYVRLCRRRFWKGDYSEDKISAYQTLYTCMVTIAKIASPIAPFFMDRLYLDLNAVSKKEDFESVHLTDYPQVHEELIDKALEERMQLAQQISSMVLSLRKKTNLKVRQPLAKIMIPVADESLKQQISKVQDLILHEVNVKELLLVGNSEGMFVKSIKPDFKKLGPKCGKIMKKVAERIVGLSQADIATLESGSELVLDVEGQNVTIGKEDVEIHTQDIPGWVVASQNTLTVALDIEVSEELKNEGLAREFVKQIQTYRKDNGFEVLDHIKITVENNPAIVAALTTFEDYIKNETLCSSLSFAAPADGEATVDVEGIVLKISVVREA